MRRMERQASATASGRWKRSSSGLGANDCASLFGPSVANRIVRSQT
jgi:hypothetical protein